MRRLVYSLLAGVLLFQTGCGVAMFQAPADAWSREGLGVNLAHEREAAAKAEDQPGLPSPSDETPLLTTIQPRKVIYSGRFGVVVGEVEAALKAAKAMADRLGGYTLRMTLTSIVVRVPAEKFDSAVEELARMGTVVEKDMTAQDVTDQVADLELRLRNAKAAQQRLAALLEKSPSVKDTLDIERELQRLTTEIEQLEGQINKLSHLVAYSTLTITFIRPVNAPSATQVRLPFRWLSGLGLSELLAF